MENLNTTLEQVKIQIKSLRELRADAAANNQQGIVNDCHKKISKLQKEIKSLEEKIK